MIDLTRTLSYMVMIPALALATVACDAGDSDIGDEEVEEEFGEAPQAQAGAKAVGNGFIYFFATIEDGHEHAHTFRNMLGFALMSDGTVQGGGANVVLEGDEGILPLKVTPESWSYVEEADFISICWSYVYLQSGEEGGFCEGVPVSEKPAAIDINFDGINDGIFRGSLRD